MTMAIISIPAHLVMAVFAVHAAASHAKRSSSSSSPLIPYIPTTILIPGSTTGTVDTTDENENSTAYVFAPNDAGDSADFLSVDITSTLNTSSLSSSSTAKTLTSGLPFISSSISNTSTFVPVLALDGSIIVFSGNCASDTTDSSAIWIYNTTSKDPSWAQHEISSSTEGPYFLGGGLAFSDIISPSLSSPSIYAYGGQCPNADLTGDDDADDSDGWVSAADYTNTMVKLSPSSSDSYDSEMLSLKSQPIAEAGFSFTPLRPSTSNISGTVTQSINAVVLGGHTQSAFVNMSTAAVWSLPEESWSFISISGPSTFSSSSDTSELARNDEEDDYTTVTSRSGHTAVLNEEGTALIVLGGWVGNTSQPATPQLAVLQMNGSTYGEWEWTVPENQPSFGSDDGEGIYGHGAALLPGNVMMISGGYSISSSPSSSASKLRPRADVAAGSSSFFNITSLSWSDSYTNPSSLSGSSSSAPSSAGSAATTSTGKLGLGLGLGLGIPFLLALLALAIYCIRRRRRYRHSVRDEHMRNLASGHAFITSEEMLERHDNISESLWGSAGAAAARWYYTGGHDPYLRDNEKSLGYESLRGSSTRNNGAGSNGAQGGDFDSDAIMAVEPVAGYKNAMRRKPAPRVAKGLYQPTGVDESRALGAIHPILEDEEDEMLAHGAMSPDKEMEGGEEDPFMTPQASPTRERGRDSTYYSSTTQRGDSPGPSSPITPIQPQHPEVQDWVTDIDASDALITARLQPRSTTTTATTAYRNSRGTTPPPPTRRQSLREDNEARTDSNLSESNRSAFSFMPSRTDSLRVAAAAGTAPAWLTSNNNNNSSSNNNSNSQEARGSTSHSDHSSSGNSNSNTSYITAKSISALQAEGPTLLLGRPRAISDIYDVADDPNEPGSPSKNKPPRRSWFGSLRRVFSNGHSSGDSSSGTSIQTDSPHSGAQGESNDYDRLGLGGLGLGGIGLLQKRRQGRSAWATGGEDAALRGNSNRDPWEEEGEEDDWDIEKAVEQRLVQVMFSVPKERLRIVNGDPEILSLAESAVMVDLAETPNGTSATIHTNHDNHLDENPLSPIDEDEKILEKGKQRAEDEIVPIRLTRVASPPQPFDEVAPEVNEAKQEFNEMVEPVRSETPPRREFRSSTPSSTTTASSKRPALLLKVPPLDRADSEPPSASGSPSRSRALTPSPGVPMTAEEIRFERPRSRVLAMVEQLEERGRSDSPSPSHSPAKSLRGW